MNAGYSFESFLQGVVFSVREWGKFCREEWSGNEFATFGCWSLKSTLSRSFCERIWDFYLVRSLSVVFECSGVEFFLQMNVKIWAEIAIFLPCNMACFCSEN